MKVERSSDQRQVPLDPAIYDVLPQITERELRDYVTWLSVPRHPAACAPQNGMVRKFLANLLRSWGYDVQILGHQFNLVAGPPDWPRDPCLLVGAHYDSMPQTPGADDNASGLAVMLACARLLTLHPSRTPVVFAAFNSEEDGALGSQEFVETIRQGRHLQIRQAVVLEMVGFASDRRGSQRVPPGLPLQLPDQGNFLGMVANWHSRQALEGVLRVARTYLPDFPVLGLHMAPAVEAFLPMVHRSDHAPFWRAGIPALMWTDTAEFRNPHYHRPTDTPDTLDYAFMSQVLLLLVACCLHGPVAAR